MKIILLILFCFLVSFTTSSHEMGVKVRIFNTEIELPSGCIMYAGAKLVEGESVYYFCEVEQPKYSSARVTFKISNYSEILDIKNDSSFVSLTESVIGEISHFYIVVQFKTQNGLTKGQVNIFCDRDICMKIVGDYESLLTSIISQLKHNDT